MKAAKLAKLNSRNRLAKQPEPAPLRLDLGSGPNKKAGFLGVDAIAFPGVDVVCNLADKAWPWDDASVEEAHASHFIEHLDAMQRVHFFNELHRVLKPGAKCTLITPHWSSCRAYGDPTHKWPPVSEFLWYYLKADWRAGNAPHTDAKYLPGGFACNFEVTWGYSLEPGIATRNQEYQQMAIQYYKEACQDTIATLTKC